ncbi:MAG: porin [Rhodobacteraceae bacterium]|nr:porin [Paracoccaceae bacterium]MAY47047.1 porin [Paracoccaceae bacterium]QEW19768.1 hypothetical protein LA6_001958 [Marinibacterium anthonyi]
MRKAYFPAALAIGLVLPAGMAAAGPKYTNDSGGTMWYYGQLNPGYLSADDGSDTTDELIDNSASNSRVGIWIVQPFDNGMEFSFNLETGLGFRSSSGLSQLNAGDRSWFDWDQQDIRKVDLSLKTSYGTVWAGQGSMASDGAGQVDKSGTTLAGYVSLRDVAGAILLRDSTGALTDVTIGSAFDSYDGGRYGRIRYETPDLAGFTVSAAWGQEILDKDSDDEFWDAALRYRGEFGNVLLDAAVGYQSRMRPGAEDRNDTFASASLYHLSGVSLTLGVGERNTAGTYVYTKLGYKRDWLPIGDTAVSIDYYSADDMGLTGTATSSSSDAIGVELVQQVADYNLEGYLGYRSYSFDDNSATSYKDASTVLVGARWKF